MSATLDDTLALVTLADVKEFLKITTGTTSEDSIITFLINEVSRAINNFTGRHLRSKTHTEYYNGTGCSTLILAHYPIISVSSIHEDVQRVFATSNLIAADDYMIMKDSGVIELWNGRDSFIGGRAVIKVVYTAGYASDAIPQDLQLAVKRWVAVHYLKYVNKRHEEASMTVGDKTITYLDQEIPKDVARLLQIYKRQGDAPDYAFSQ